MRAVARRKPLLGRHGAADAAPGRPAGDAGAAVAAGALRAAEEADLGAAHGLAARGDVEAEARAVARADAARLHAEAQVGFARLHRRGQLAGRSSPRRRRPAGPRSGGRRRRAALHPGRQRGEGGAVAGQDRPQPVRVAVVRAVDVGAALRSRSSGAAARARRRRSSGRRRRSRCAIGSRVSSVPCSVSSGLPIRPVSATFSTASVHRRRAARVVVVGVAARACRLPQNGAPASGRAVVAGSNSSR